MTVGAGYEIGPVLAHGDRPWPRDWLNSIVCLVCPHTEWESVLVPPYDGHPLAEVVRCIRCHAPRCGGVREADPCMKVFGHPGWHWTASHHLERPVDKVEVS